MKLSEFTEPECEYFRKMCNFTPEELQVFNMRVKDASIIKAYRELNMTESTVNRRIKAIKQKIRRVL